MDELPKLIEEIGIDLWHRFRAIALAIDQAQRFVAMPQGGESIDEKELWLQDLGNHPDEIDSIATDLVLRAFRIAVDPTNYLLLQKMKVDNWVPYSDLMQSSGLNRLLAGERINDLIQAGLVVKDVQTEQVQMTKAGQRLIEFMEEIQKVLAKTMQEKLKRSGPAGRYQE